MSTSYLPKTITKDVLFKEAQVRFQHWVNLYADPNVSAQYMYEVMSASCYCGNPEDDFPDDVKAERDSVIKYQYNDMGACSFMIDGIEVDVLDLRDMRKDKDAGIERYTDVCTIAINYKDESDCDMFLYHLIPDAWLYGSTSEDFEEGHEVDSSFIEAARAFIKQHHITPAMQEVPD